MNTYTTVAALTAAIEQAKKEHKTIGLVPTMGALHEGHLSLVNRARKENDIVVVSVFVNPIQFNNQEDLAKYPRTVDADLEKLTAAGADIAFVPSVEEMYPEKVETVYHFGPLEEVMEGPHRPGHFSGVAVVVRRLFDLTQPDRAYFGEKDVQQIAIIHNLLDVIKRIQDEHAGQTCPFDRQLFTALMLAWSLPAPFIIPLYADLKEDGEYVSTCLSVMTVVTILTFIGVAAYSLA